MKLIAETKQWPPNYRFAYLLVWGGAVVAAVSFLVGLVVGVQPLTLGIAAVVALYSAFLVWRMPAWALNADEEAERRRKARQAREELRRR